MRTASGAAVAVAVALSAAVAAVGLAGCGGGTPRARVGQPAPLFESVDLGGHPTGLAASRGHVVLLNFWASWCIPCQAEFPLLAGVESRHPGLTVLGVVHQDAQSAAAGFARAHHATWDSVIDPRNQISSAYGVGLGIPVTIAIDARGVVRARHIGQLRDAADADALARAAGA